MEHLYLITFQIGIKTGTTFVTTNGAIKLPTIQKIISELNDKYNSQPMVTDVKLISTYDKEG